MPTYTEQENFWLGIYSCSVKFKLFNGPFRPEMVVGWYHSHPGFGCWLSGVDINTQQSFEALSDRAVAVVVDPIQSVKGQFVNGHIGLTFTCLFQI